MDCEDRAVCTALPRETSPDVQVTTLERTGCTEYHVTAVPTAGESPETMLEHAAAVIREHEAVVVAQDVFGLPNEGGAGDRVLAAAFGEVSWPITWLKDGDDRRLAGTHIWAVRGPRVDYLRLDGRVVGGVFEDETARYCRLAGVVPASAAGSREDQARETFKRLAAALEQTQMSFADVVRTWLYLDDLLDWYGSFNRVRDQFFTELGVFGHLVPASTGISGGNPARTAIVAGALAIAPKDPSVKMFPVASPLQCPALDYGSSFSRAVEIDGPECRRLLVSGTASIHPGGATAHVGNAPAQIELTMAVVGAILESRDMDWAETTRAIVYFKDPADVPAFHDYCARAGLPPLPVVVTHNHVCRHDLLYEIEIDAVQLRR